MKRFFSNILEKSAVYSLLRSPVAMVAAFLLFMIVFGAVLFFFIMPFDFAQVDLLDAQTPPWSKSEFSGRFFALGTDNAGRDLLPAIFYGLRVSLAVGILAVTLALVIGVILGLIAGYLGGAVDEVIMRIADAQLALPSFIVAMLLSGVLRLVFEVNELFVIGILVIAIALAEWVPFARTVRSSVLVESKKEYILAAQIMGLPKHKIIRRHLLPNVLGPVFVIAAIGLSIAITTEATLSYLGLGMPPTHPSLGTLISKGFETIGSEPWTFYIPTVFLVVLALSVNLLGDWLRDYFNPKLR